MSSTPAPATAPATGQDTGTDAGPRASARGDRWARLATPPHPWQHRPASLAAMHRYATRGGWTGPDGLARAAGVWWYRLVALPVCLCTHYLAWLVARPARALTVAALVLLAWLTLT